MANRTNVEKFEEQVCAALGAELDVDFEASTINLPIYAGAALRDVRAIVPDVDTITQDDERRSSADIAIVYATAVKLLPHWQQIKVKREQTPGANVENFETDWEDFREWLEGERDKALGELSPEFAAEQASGSFGFRLTFGPMGTGAII